MSDRLLMDTHVLLWAVEAPAKLSRAIRAAIDDGRYVVSVASLWELVNKKERRDAPVKDPVAWWERYVARRDAVVLPIRPAHVLYLDRLPLLHRDPFDRILLAQAAVEEMTLVTADAQMRAYAIPTRPATA